MTSGARRVLMAANRGTRANGRAIAVKVAMGEEGSGEPISIAVPRRTGNAVRRNLIRRQIREILRLGGERIKPDARVRISVLLAGLSYSELEQELWELLQRAGALK